MEGTRYRTLTLVDKHSAVTLWCGGGRFARTASGRRDEPALLSLPEASLVPSHAPPTPPGALAPQLSGLWASLPQVFVLGSCDQLFRKRALRGQHVGLPRLTGFLCFCFWP